MIEDYEPIKHRTCQKCKLGKYDCMFPMWGKHVGIWCKRCMDKDGLKFEAMAPMERLRFLPTMRKPAHLRTGVTG